MSFANEPGFSARMKHPSIRALGWLVASLALLGADWQSCQNELDRLRSRAGEASDRASSTRTASLAMEARKREMDECRATDPKGCRVSADAYDAAQKQVQAARRSLEGALDDADSSLRAANTACDYSMSVTTAPSAVGDPICWLLQRSKGHVSTDRVMEMCKRVGKSEEQCRACLQ